MEMLFGILPAVQQKVFKKLRFEVFVIKCYNETVSLLLVLLLVLIVLMECGISEQISDCCA